MWNSHHHMQVVTKPPCMQPTKQSNVASVLFYFMIHPCIQTPALCGFILCLTNQASAAAWIEVWLGRYELGWWGPRVTNHALGVLLCTVCFSTENGVCFSSENGVIPLLLLFSPCLHIGDGPLEDLFRFHLIWFYVVERGRFLLWVRLYYISVNAILCSEIVSDLIQTLNQLIRWSINFRMARHTYRLLLHHTYLLPRLKSTGQTRAIEGRHSLLQATISIFSNKHDMIPRRDQMPRQQRIADSQAHRSVLYKHSELKNRSSSSEQKER